RRRREILATAAAPHLRLLLLCSSSPAARISRQSAAAPVRPHLQLLHISPCLPFSVDWPDLQSLAVRTCSPASVARLPARLQYTLLCSQALCSALRLCSALSIVCTSLCLCYSEYIVCLVLCFCSEYCVPPALLLLMLRVLCSE